VACEGPTYQTAGDNGFCLLQQRALAKKSLGPLMERLGDEKPLVEDAEMEVMEKTRKEGMDNKHQKPMPLAMPEEVVGKTDQNQFLATSKEGMEKKDQKPLPLLGYSVRSEALTKESAHHSTRCSVFRGSLDDNAAHYNGWYSPAWGNLLSEYWEARGAAALAGVNYEGSPIPGETWLSKLPFKHDSDPALKDLSALDKMCNDCTGGMFPHLCEGKWTRIRQMIRDDTQAALKNFAQEANVPLPAFHENDVLVHIRLEPVHPQIAYYAKSFFDGRITKRVSRIILLSAEPQWGRPILDSYFAMFEELCLHRQPQCIVDKQSGTQFADFAAIALAPTVFCSGSTYCLWAAMANRGKAIMSSHHIASGKMPHIDDWTWVAGHVLPNAERKNMPTEEWISHVVKWVREN